MSEGYLNEGMGTRLVTKKRGTLSIYFAMQKSFNIFIGKTKYLEP